MDDAIRRKILEVLAGHRVMTIATLRPDGWPQATIVAYVSDALTLYFFCGPHSQKVTNLAHDGRVSVTVGSDEADVMATAGLSMAAHAERVTDDAEARRVIRTMLERYPSLPEPLAQRLAVYRVTPTVISVIDYTKGFGHTDLVTL